MTTYNNVLDVFSYAAHTLANTLWSERALRKYVYPSIPQFCYIKAGFKGVLHGHVFMIATN